jgi:hypothetical protein
LKEEPERRRYNDPTLRCPAEIGSIFPFFEVTGLDQVVNQVEEAAIVDFLSEDRHQDSMVNVVETTFDVTLDEPFHSGPGV